MTNRISKRKERFQCVVELLSYDFCFGDLWGLVIDFSSLILYVFGELPKGIRAFFNVLYFYFSIPLRIALKIRYHISHGEELNLLEAFMTIEQRLRNYRRHS